MANVQWETINRDNQDARVMETILHCTFVQRKSYSTNMETISISFIRSLKMLC